MKAVLSFYIAEVLDGKGQLWKIFNYALNFGPELISALADMLTEHDKVYIQTIIFNLFTRIQQCNFIINIHLFIMLVQNTLESYRQK